MPQATPAEMLNNVAGFSCPVVRGKKVTDAFDGGRPTSDGGVLVLAIACGYEDADDLNALRDDLGFRLALGKLPGSGPALPAN